ncbi:MAG: PEGA domain-containing protein [Deltaproteobacteria bacterium]|nr:PEGA domain-containing protein [Deltaproteobacteria bacterium]
MSTRIALVALAANLASTGCASFLFGDTDRVSVESIPAGARVTVEPGGQTLWTPDSILLRSGELHRLTFELEGYEPRVEEVAPQQSAAILGNLLFGGIIGIWVDRRSGAAYRLFPNPVRVALEAGTDDDGENPSLTRIAFFNVTPVHAVGGRALIAVELDDLLAGTIERNRSLELDVEPGAYRLRLRHRDLFLYEDEYELVVGDEPMYIEVFSRMLSTRFQQVDRPPDGFAGSESPGAPPP